MLQRSSHFPRMLLTLHNGVKYVLYMEHFEDHCFSKCNYRILWYREISKYHSVLEPANFQMCHLCTPTLKSQNWYMYKCVACLK